MFNFRGQVQGFVIGAAVMAAVMLGAPALASQPAFPTKPLTDPAAVAAVFGATIVWNTDACAGQATSAPSYMVTLGCVVSDKPNVVNLRTDIHGAKLHRVELHELAHVLQHRLGVPVNECAADTIAHALGSADDGFYCKG